MNTLVLYSTRTGHTGKIAARIADELGGELALISDGKDYPGFWGFVRAAVAGQRNTEMGQEQLGSKRKYRIKRKHKRQM